MYADEADAPPPALDLSQEELRKRLRALPPGFDKNALKPLKMLSRTGRATAKRRKRQNGGSAKKKPKLARPASGYNLFARTQFEKFKADSSFAEKGAGMAEFEEKLEKVRLKEQEAAKAGKTMPDTQTV